MAITKAKKKDLINQHQKHKTDTGSPEVQVSVLTERINNLSTHLSTNPKDHQSKCGLLLMVGKRKRHLSYLKETNSESYRKILDLLAIRN